VNDLPGKSGHFKRTWLAKPPNLAMTYQENLDILNELGWQNHQIWLCVWKSGINDLHDSATQATTYL
jgi:hypothetical protein